MSKVKLSSLMKKDSQLAVQAEQSGLINGIALECYKIICNNAGLTVGEVYEQYVKQFPRTTRSRNEIAKRVSDLKNWGVVAAGNTTICSYSGKKAYVLSATGNAVPNKNSSNTTSNISYEPIVERPVANPYQTAEANDAVRILSRLRFNTKIVAGMSKVLFFVPGLGKKNQELARALDVALRALRG